MEIEEVLLTVIIPVYNTEKYLERCVQSVQNNIRNSNASVEIILIDDGSPDNSGAICDRLAEEYENIVCKHIENGGVSNARNMGISLAKGKYVCFLDSDDFWVGNGNFQKLAEILKADEHEIVLNGFYKVDDKERIFRTIAWTEKSTTGGYAAAVVNFPYGSHHLCSMYISKEFLKAYEIYFDTSLKRFEDMQFSYVCLWCANTIKRIAAPFFAYSYNASSVTHSSQTVASYLSVRLHCHYAVLKLAELSSVKSIPEDNENIKKYFLRFAVLDIIGLIEGYCKLSIKYKKLNQWLEDNGLMSRTKEYTSYDLEENERKKFEKYFKHPLCFALAIRTKAIFRKIVFFILPNRIVAKRA